MPIQLIVNTATGERGYQVRAEWQTPAGAARRLRRGVKFR